MYLFFDTETTGLPADYKAPIENSANWPRLVQLAYLLYDTGGGLLKRINFIIKPDGFEIPKESTDVHGITNEVAEKDGLPLAFVLGAFWSVTFDCSYIVAHNLQYDSAIMGAEYFRVVQANPIANLKGICTKLASTKYCQLPGKYGYKWPTLSELHEKLFGFDFEEKHDALSDVRATAKCFWELKERGIIKV